MKDYNSNYSPMLRKNFESALSHLLYTEYRFLGGKRVIGMIVNDVKKLIGQFYQSNLCVGQVIWPAVTKDKPSGYQKKIEDHKIVPVILNLVIRGDIKKHERGVRFKDVELARTARLFLEAYEPAGLLTEADVSVLLGKSRHVVSCYVREYQEKHNIILPTRGNIHDIGPGITHKSIIMKKKLDKKSTSEIARETNHSPESVDWYIRDYGRIKVLLCKKMGVDEISYATGISKGVVEEYHQLIQDEGEKR